MAVCLKRVYDAGPRLSRGAPNPASRPRLGAVIPAPEEAAFRKPLPVKGNIWPRATAGRPGGKTRAAHERDFPGRFPEDPPRAGR
jgi:hypothetical protein